MNLQAALDISKLVGVGIAAVEAIKGAKGADKEAAVIASAKPVLAGVEGVIGNRVNDAAFDELLQNYIRTRIALANFLTKPQPEGVILPKPAA